MKNLSKHTRKGKTHGFTLVELLVALFVLALLSAFAFRGINILMDAQNTIDSEIADLNELQKVFLILSRDWQQHIPQKTFPQQSNSTNAADQNNFTENFVRSSAFQLYTIAAGATNTPVLRVRYELKGNKLWRETQAINSGSSTSMVLLENINSMDIRALQPTNGITNPNTRGIQISLQHKRFGNVRRIISLPNKVKSTQSTL